MVEELRKRGGVATWSELKASVERDHLDGALAAGRVSRIRRNLYVLADIREVRRIAIAAGGVASHLTAAQHWGWKVKDPPERPCITLGRGSRTPTGDLELHWQDLASTEIAGHVTRRVPTVIACARSYDEAAALCVAHGTREGGQGGAARRCPGSQPVRVGAALVVPLGGRAVRRTPGRGRRRGTR